MQHDAGEADYRKASFERLAESFVLYKSEMFAGSVYLAGRAVESILRAVIWKHDNEIRTGRKSLDTGHDLRQLLARVNALGVVKDEEHHNELAGNVQRVGRIWFNNMRFSPTSKMERAWRKLDEIGRRRTLKQAVCGFHETCSAIVKRCETLCG